MQLGNLNQEQVERLQIAVKKKKYGHLATWKELFYYQSRYATPKQAQEIAYISAKKNKGEDIKLPLATFYAQQQKL